MTGSVDEEMRKQLSEEPQNLAQRGELEGGSLRAKYARLCLDEERVGHKLQEVYSLFWEVYGPSRWEIWKQLFAVVRELERISLEKDHVEGVLFREAWSSATGAAARDMLLRFELAGLLFRDSAHMLAEASAGSTIPNSGGGHARTVEMNDDGMLPAQSSTGRDGGGSEALGIVDEAVGRAVCIDMDMDAHTSQQSDQASEPTARTPNPWTTGYSGSLHNRGITVEGIGYGVTTGHQLFAHTLAQAEGPSSTILNGGGDDAHAGEMVNGLTAGARARAGDEADGRAVFVAMEGLDDHSPQQSHQTSVAATRPPDFTDGVDVQLFLSTVFGGLAVLSFTNLHSTSKGDYPEFIKLGLYIGYTHLIGLTFLGLATKKLAKPAMRVVAGMSITAVTIAAMYEVSDKMYIKCIIGITGAIGTLAMAVVKWR